ncbi:hypothetical protein ABPG72_000659 [Tetrahymena utriculariae]
MGGKKSKLLCCPNGNVNVSPSSNNKKSNRRQSFQSDHYQNVEDYLVDRSSTHDSISQKMSFQPLFFDFNKCSLTSQSHLEKGIQQKSDSRDKCNKFDHLIEYITDFFDTKPYANPYSSMLVQSQLQYQFQLHSDLKEQYERAFIESKEPSELTVYLKKGQTNNTKFYDQVNEYIFQNVKNLDEYLEKVEVKLNDQMDHQIESSQILYQQKLKEGLQLQIIYVIFKKLNYQKSRDLVYLKIHKRIDENQCIQVYQSVQIKCEQNTLVDSDSDQTIVNASPGVAVNANQAVNNNAKQPLKKQKTNGQKIRKVSSSSNVTTDEKYERAMLYIGGKKINFVPEKNEVHLQELHSLDMKIDTQHIFQKEVIIHHSKKIFEKIKNTLSQKSSK